MKKGGSFIVDPVNMGQVFSREHFTEEHKMFENAVKEFAKDRILPAATELSILNKDLSLEIFREMGELGFLAIDFPEDAGGLALDKVATNIAAECLLFGGSASIAVTFSDHTGIGTLPIIWYGTKTQKEKYLPKLATGEWMGSFALTEADAGSDVTTAKVSAKLNEAGTHYILNGAKIFVTNGSWADNCITFAKVDGEKYTAFILDKDCPGWVVGPEEHKMGIKGSSTCTYFFEDCKVPIDNVLGKVGQGTAIALNVLYTGRYKLGATTMGGAKFVINLAVNYAFEREQFDRPIAEFGMIKRKFANMITRAWEADTIVYMTAGSIDRAMKNIPPSNPKYYDILKKVIEDHGIEASIAKIIGSEALAYNIDEAVQIYGGAGYIEDYPVSIIYRDERINRIFEGTSEINRLIIGATTLKKAILEELPIRDMIAERSENWLPDLDFDKDFALKKEAEVIEFSRSLLLYTLNELILKFGQDFKNEQWAIELLANMMISLAIMDSGFKRFTSLPEHYKHRESVELIVKLSVCDQYHDLCQNAIDLQGLIFDEDEYQKQENMLRQKQIDLDYYPEKIKTQQKITDLLYQHKQYYLD